MQPCERVVVTGSGQRQDMAALSYKKRGTQLGLAVWTQCGPTGRWEGESGKSVLTPTKKINARLDKVVPSEDAKVPDSDGTHRQSLYGTVCRLSV